MGSSGKSMVPKISFSSGLEIPILGLGTYGARDNECIQVVKEAIDIGYRHFDTAAVYENEKEIGVGIKEKIEDGTVKRGDLFVTSKLWCGNARPDMVVPALKQTLANLSLDYLDLYLIHWPFAFKEETGEFMPLGEDGKFLLSSADYVNTWKEMEKCMDLGLVKSIGISNFNRQQISRLLDHARIKPVINQVECHPFLNQKKLLEYCDKNDIRLTAYSPLANPGRQVKTGKPKLIDNPILLDIGNKYNKTAAQVSLKYLVKRGIICIPKSVNKIRMKENIDVFDFDLSEEDMNLINELNTNTRTCPFTEVSHSPFYPFHDEY